MELLARTCNTERMNVQRILARAFVVLGGLFWIVMIWGANYAYLGSPFGEVAGWSILTAALVAGVFVLGLYYEKITSLLLVVGVIALVITGIVFAWGTGVWATSFFFLMLPMLVAAALYWQAARMQEICEA